MTDVAPLFRPFRIRGLTLKNRIVMAPMTRARSPGAFPNDDNVGYYARRAAGDVGLILSEGTLTRRKGAGNDANIPLFWGERPLAGWKRVIDAVHAAGGKMGPQLWHQGMSRKPGTGHFPDAPSDGPSGITLQGEKVADEPSEAEVLDMAQAYADAAADAKRLGFDCVELHGAHGYLIDEFFWERTNRRTDRFGGSIEKRAEFAAEVIRRCRLAVGELPIIIRISQWKSADYAAKVASTPQELERWVKCPRRCRRRCHSLLAAPHPRAGISRRRWAERPQSRRLGKETIGAADDQRRLRRAEVRIHRRISRRRLERRQAR